MAIPQGSAPARPRTGSPAPSTAPAAHSGVIRVRSRHTGHFTVLANRLARRAGSAVTIGVAAYVFSLPDGAPISIKALCAHFDEGEVLIGRALRELEADGWIERRVERTSCGRIRTRTFVYDDPGAGPVGDAPARPAAVRPAARQASVSRHAPGQTAAAPHEATPSADRPAQATTGRPEPACPGLADSATETADSPAAPAPPPPTADQPQDPEPCAPPPPADPPGDAADPAPAPENLLPAADGVPDPRPLSVLRSLRTRDPRLTLTEQEIRHLAPAVGRWLSLGAGSTDIAEALSTGLPAHFDRRPDRLLAYRLAAWQPPVPHTSPPVPAPVAVPLRTCEGCDRAFRSPHPGRCRDCRNSPADARHAA